ncbi:MAG: TatD family hydrolase [Pseudomonadota bacterium]
MKLFDSHCHLNDNIFAGDMDAVISRFNIAGGLGIMIAGIDEASCRRAVTLADTTDICHVSLGVHPHHAAECSEATLTSLKTLAAHPKVRAWGEIGLDYNRMYSPMESQEKWFIRQIETADTLDLPIIFHERDTHGRFLQILQHHTNSDRKGVIHCFSGNRKELEAYLELGLSIGITGIITLKSRGDLLRELVSLIPANRLLVETDAPWLTPSPERNRQSRNEPAFVGSVLLKLAAIRNEDPEILSETVYQNTCRLFQVR